MLNEKQLNILRVNLEKHLSNYKGSKKIKIDIDSKILEKIIFEYKKEKLFFEYGEYKTFVLYTEFLKKLDFSNISFDNFKAHEFDFNGFYGVKLNPQTLYKKDLSWSKLSGVEIIGPLDNCVIIGTDFTGSTEAKLNPQTVYKKDLRCAKLSEVEIIGPLDNCKIFDTDFTGSIGAYISDEKYPSATDIYNNNLTDLDIRISNEEFGKCLKKLEKAFKQ